MSGRSLEPGPLAFDPTGLELTPVEREMLAHPLVGGVILFRHNFHDAAQLKALIASCRAARPGPLLVYVDHEGGRVQRFRDGFSALPSASVLGARFQQDEKQALHEALAIGRVMASELFAVGVDINLAPVVDLAGNTSVIGDRAFAQQPDRVSLLSAAVVRGMHDGGLAAVAKHFPGHGGAREDTHNESACDPRSMATLLEQDIAPFAHLIAEGIDGILPAHVRYPAIDQLPAGFSPAWLQDILRGRLQFDGLIVSDDLSMAAAALDGGIVASTEAALRAGCDVVLSCQKPDAVVSVLDGPHSAVCSAARSRRLRQIERNRQKRKRSFNLSDARTCVDSLNSTGCA